MPPKEQAIVKPMKEIPYTFKQSRFEHLAASLPVPWRVLCSGRSQAGKTELLRNVVTSFWRGTFEKIYIFSRTARLDSTYKAIIEYAEKLGQDESEEPFVWEDLDVDALTKIMQERKSLIQRIKANKETHKLPAVLVIIDDMSDSEILQKRSGPGVIAKMFTMGRHFGVSIWCNVHSVNSLGPLARKQASGLILFKITNAREYESVKEQFSHLVGRDEFDALYDIAAGKQSPAYSFLSIFPNAHRADDPENPMFMARFDQALLVVDPDEEAPFEGEVTKATQLPKSQR